MRTLLLAPFLIASALIAQTPAPKPVPVQMPKPAAPAPAKPAQAYPNIACSSEADASGFTECERMRLQLYQTQLQPYYDQINPIIASLNKFVGTIVAQHPGMIYQQSDHAFPFGHLVPAPPPEPKPDEKVQPKAVPAPTPK